MKLVSFTKSHYQILINWVKEPETLFNFAGIGFNYPLTEEQLDKYLASNPDRKPFLAIDTDSNPIAFGEIIPQGEASARLGHLIIGESQNRGKGVGQQFIKALNQKAKLQLQIKNMDLFVLEGNMPAINCYLKSGFNFIPNDFTITNEGKSIRILKMTLPL